MKDGSKSNIKKKIRNPEHEIKTQKFIRIPKISVESLESKDDVSEEDYTLIPIPVEDDDLKLDREESEDEIGSEDLLLLRKERYINAAIKHEKLENLEIALIYYEKAALSAKKLGQINESKVYYKKFEVLDRKLEERYNRGEYDSRLTWIVKTKILSKKYRDFINDVGKHVQLLSVELNSPGLEKIFERRREKSKKTTKAEKNIEKVPNNRKTSNLTSIPFIKKKQVKRFQKQKGFS